MKAPLTGLIGYPVAHSRSPVIHHYWAKKYTIATRYDLYPMTPDQLEKELSILRAKQISGFNVTVPHKQAIIPHLDQVDALAKRIGAVNTVMATEAGWVGTNTDAYGFIENLKQTLPNFIQQIENVLLLGSGGATRAAIVGLQDAGAKIITITNRTMETAEKMAKEFGVNAIAWEEKEVSLPGVTLLVNTTSLGMDGKPDLLLNINNLQQNAVVHDIVYSPLETPLLREARVGGWKTVDGLGMLLYQAQRAFFHWHGIVPEVDDALRQCVMEE